MDDNVKQDLLKAIAESGHKESDIKCAVLSIHFDYNDSYEMKIYRGENEFHERYPNSKYLVLKEGYTLDELQKFIAETDVSYYTGFGGQTLYGYVMFHDQSWLERGEYDGSEWWEFKKFFIPEQCKRQNSPTL